MGKYQKELSHRIIFDFAIQDRYADELAKAMQKALLIGKVAALGRNIEQQTGSKKTVNLDASRYVEMDETMTKDGAAPDDVTIKSTHQDVLDGLRMSSEQKVRIEELLGAWEEPDVGYKQDVSLTPRNMLLILIHVLNHI